MSKDRESTEEKDSRSGHKSVKGLAWTYAPPWLGWLLSGPVSVVMYLAWGRRAVASELVAILLTVAVGALTAFTNELAGKNRSAVFIRLARGTVMLVGGWMIGAFVFAPWHHPWIDLWFLGGAITCLFWTVRRALLSKASENGEVGGMAGKLVDVLDGARMHNVRAEQTKLGQVVKARGEVARGEQSVKDLQGKADAIASVAHLRPGSVVITGDPTDAGAVDVIITPTDLLAGEVLWEGPDRPGKSIALPIKVGPYVDGTECRLTLPGSETERRNLAHMLVQAVTGGGKSNFVCQLMAKVLCRTEVVVIASDPVKGLQTLGPFIDTGALELVSLDQAGSRQMLAAVKRAIADRGTYLGGRGFKQWESGCGLCFLVVWLEEANWATQLGVLEDIAAQARSVGIWLLVSQQRAAYTTTSTDLRGNMQAGACGGVDAAMDAKFCLPDDLVDQVGDMLESWGADKPGYFVINHPSIRPQDRPKPVRSEYATDDQIREVLLEHAPTRTVMDAVTRGAFGATYDLLKQVMGGADPAKIWAKSKGKTPLPDDDEPDLMDDEDDEDFDEQVEAEQDMRDEDTPRAQVDPDRPVPPLPADLAGIPLGQPDNRPKLSTEAARAVVQQHLRTLLDQEVFQATPADVHHMTPPTTMTREWVRRELKRLCEAAAPGEIALRLDYDAERPGTFAIIAPAIVGGTR